MPEVPQNAGYLVAAYVVTAVILLGYAFSLYRRSTGVNASARTYTPASSARPSSVIHRPLCRRLIHPP